MNRQIVPSQQVDMETPGRRDYWVALGHTSIWGSHLIPLTVIVGPQARPGQGLVAFGGNHGNEYEGPMAVKHLLSEIRTEDVLGRIVLVPVLNVAAFRVGTRESTGDDGHNLNRVFVDGAGTTPAMAGITHRIVDFVRTVIWPHVHISIDLHSGGEVARFIHWAVWYSQDDPMQDAVGEKMARWFGTRVVMGGQAGPPGGASGALFQDAVARGKHAIATELGHGSAVDVRGVRFARQGVLAAAIHNGQLRGTIEPIGHQADGTQRLIRRSSSVTAPYPGHYEPLFECGEVVSKGTVVGLLHDFYRIDEEPFACVAGVDGVVISQAWGARVEQGQTILMVGEEVG